MDDITFTVDFSSADAREDGDDILLSGPLFKAGDYPDKKFSMTPAEMWHTIKGFVSPKPMDFEHWTSVFSTPKGKIDLRGAFGAIERVWADEDGEWMHAEVRKPRWLHTYMPETRVSASFAKTPEKPLVGAAWTDDPRVDGAELVAAFASSKGRPRHDTRAGQGHLQMVHDMSAAAGAICTQVGMASRHEAKGIQAIHDEAVSHGAQCDPAGGPMDTVFTAAPDEVEPVTPTRDESAHGSEATGLSNTEPAPRRFRPMKLFDFLKTQAAEAGIELTDEDMSAEFSGPALAKTEELEAELQARDARIAALEAQAARDESARRTSEAVSFANARVDQKRITPDSVASLAALVARVSDSDVVATFSDGEKATTTLLEEFLATLPDLAVFTTNVVLPEGAQAIAGQETTPGADGEITETDLSPERRERLLKATPAGREAIRNLNQA